MSVHVTVEHLRQTEKFVRSIKRADGLIEADTDRFWAAQAQARKTPWAADCPQMPLGMAGMSIECVWEELGEPEDWRRLHDDATFRDALARRYNDKAEKVVGRRLLEEDSASYLPQPPIKAVHDIFEARNVWEGQSWWLERSATTPDELRALLDRVERRLENLRAFLLPDGWDEVKARFMAAGGKIAPCRKQRGPVTLAMSIYGLEDLIYLLVDDAALAGRFRDLIIRAILERTAVIDQEAGITPETGPRRWSWSDDNCAMLTADMYDFFGKPILKAVFDRYAPGPDDLRYQHSDSDMAQHLPTLGELGINNCNFGPNLTVAQIRRHLPTAVIFGQLAPFTFSRNEEINMVAEFLRDLEMSRERRGVVFSTAGSINNGSRLTGLRLLMAAAQNFY